MGDVVGIEKYSRECYSRGTMKSGTRIVVPLCALAFALLAPLAAEAQNIPRKGTVFRVAKVAQNDVLNIRSEPDYTDANVVADIPANGTDIYWFGEKRKMPGKRQHWDWYFLTHWRVQGWVNSNYLEVQETYYQIVTDASHIELRSAPGRNGRAVARMSAGTGMVLWRGKIAVMEKAAEWFKVEYNEHEGWVNAIYLRREQGCFRATASDAGSLQMTWTVWDSDKGVEVDQVVGTVSVGASNICWFGTVKSGGSGGSNSMLYQVQVDSTLGWIPVSSLERAQGTCHCD